MPARATLAVALFAALPGLAGAVEINYDVGVSVLQSDNIGLSDVDKRSETVVSPRLGFDAHQAGSVFELDARGSVQYLSYRENTFDDEFRGVFAGQALWTMSPERLQWVFEDYLSRQPIDTFESFTPGNEQQANLFVTGPTLLLRPGQATRGEIDLRYSNSRASEDKTFDGDRYNAAARLLHDIGPNRTLSANVEALRVAYDTGALLADYTRYDAYARYWSRMRTLELTIDLGYSRLEYEDRPGDTSEPLGRVDLAWNASARSVLDLAFRYELADAADNLVVGVDDVGNPANPTVPLSPDVFKQRRVELGYAFSGDRTTLEIRPYYQRVSYLGVGAQDEDSRGGYIVASYKLQPLTTLSLFAARADREFVSLDRDDRDSSIGLSLEHRFTRNWSATIQYLHRERNSTDDVQDYRENAAIVSFSYRR
jgi:hypothetical protein